MNRVHRLAPNSFFEPYRSSGNILHSKNLGPKIGTKILETGLNQLEIFIP